jgi:glycosyltransferase involved in cell wall biosynthesis
MIIKVLLIQQDLDAGGVEKRRLSIVKNLQGKGFEFKIICTYANDFYKQEFKKHGVEVIELGKIISIFELDKHKKVRLVMKEFSPTIVHGAVFEGVFLSAINGFIRKTPIIILEETSNPENRSKKATLLLRGLSQVADAFIGVSAASTSYLSKIAKVSKKKIHLINNGVPIPREVTSSEVELLKEQLGIFPNDVIIGTVSRLENDTKRITDLIDAFKIINEKVTNTKLLLVGSGKDHQLLVDYTKERDLQQTVIFTGYQSDVTPFYRLMNIFALVSQREAFGLVIAEAMLNKLPIVASNVGGIPYVIEDNVSGLLIDPLDIADITTKLLYFVNNKSQRFTYADKGYQRALTNFTEDLYTNNIKDLYTNLYQKKKG